MDRWRERGVKRRGIAGDGRELVGDRIEWRKVLYGRDVGGGL